MLEQDLPVVADAGETVGGLEDSVHLRSPGSEVIRQQTNQLLRDIGQGMQLAFDDLA